MKQIFSFIIGLVALVQLNSCVSSQAFSKACYISKETVFIKTEKLPDLAILVVCKSADKQLYEAISNQLQVALKAKNIPSDISFFLDDEPFESFTTGMKGNFQLTINPLKDEYLKDELNNPVLSKQIVFNLTRYSAQKLADIAITIDRTENPAKTGNQIAGLIFNYLKKKNFI